MTRHALSPTHQPQGDNAWFFMEEETISQAVKAYIDFEKKLKEALPREVRKEARPIDVSGEVGCHV